MITIVISTIWLYVSIYLLASDSKIGFGIGALMMAIFGALLFSTNVSVLGFTYSQYLDDNIEE